MSKKRKLIAALVVVAVVAAAGLIGLNVYWSVGYRQAVEAGFPNLDTIVKAEVYQLDQAGEHWLELDNDEFDELIRRVKACHPCGEAMDAEEFPAETGGAPDGDFRLIDKDGNTYGINRRSTSHIMISGKVWKADWWGLKRLADFIRDIS